MTGTGTQSDPYVINTVDEFYSMSEMGGEDVHFKLGSDIDFNGTEYLDNYKIAELKCASLDGNGHSIRNITNVVTSGTAYVFTVPYSLLEIKNVNFENIRFGGADAGFFYTNASSSVLTCTNCTFLMTASRTTFTNKGESSKACIMCSDKISLNFSLCSFYAKLSFLRPQAFIAFGTVKRCQFNFDITYDNAASASSYKLDPYSIFSASSVNDSYFFGSANAKATSEFIFSGNRCYYQNCYFVMSIGENISTVSFNGTFNSVCFYDKDIAGNHSFTNSNSRTRLLALTTEQCKNAEYLRSVGFECEEGN